MAEAKEVKVKTVKVKNIWEAPINFETCTLAPGEEGTISIAEAEALSAYVQKVQLWIASSKVRCTTTTTQTR